MSIPEYDRNRINEITMDDLLNCLKNGPSTIEGKLNYIAITMQTRQLRFAQIEKAGHVDNEILL